MSSTTGLNLDELSRFLHHDGSGVYVFPQLVELGQKVGLRIRIHAEFGSVVRVRVRSLVDAEPSYSEAIEEKLEGKWQWWKAELVLSNPVQPYRFLIERSDGQSFWLNPEGLSKTELRDADDFRLTKHRPLPDWAQGAVLYQIFPDRFARSALADEQEIPNWAIPEQWETPVTIRRPETSLQFYGGDLYGAKERLDYLVNLGVNIVYFTPFFPGQSNHRYDAHSFDEVDPLLGGNQALAEFVAAAHERGLKVIGDLTTNHCGITHEWFRSALGNPQAEESDFFYWTNEEHTAYESWLGVKSLPKFNWNSEELRRRFIQGESSVVAKWLKAPYGLDGWRIDVANMTGRYAEDDLNATVRAIIRKTMDEINPDTLLLAEATNDAAPDFQGEAWQGAMSYANFTRPLWYWLGDNQNETLGGIGIPMNKLPSYSAEEFLDQHLKFSSGFPWKVRLGNLLALDTHDTPRFNEVAKPGAVELAFGLSITLPGLTVVWAGAELGLGGIDGEHSRRPIPWQNLEQYQSGLELYRNLVALKSGYPALRNGGIRWIRSTENSLLFSRETESETIVVLLNAEAKEESFQVDRDLVVVSSESSPERIYGRAELEENSAELSFKAPAMSFNCWRWQH